MSTILKALKRLEEDAPTPDDTAISSGSTHSRPPASTREGRSAPPSSSMSPPSGGNPETIPATDPRATENLRQRILAEEAAAQSSEVARVTESEGSLTTFFSRRPVQIAAAIVLGLGFGLIGYGLSSRPSANDPQIAQTAQRRPSTQPGTQPSAPPPSPSEFAASDPVAPTPSYGAPGQPPSPVSADPRAAFAPSAPSPSVAVAAAPRVRAERRPESAIPLAAVAPTPAVRAAESAPKATPAPVAPAPRRVASAPPKLKPEPTNTRPPPPAPAASSRPRPTERERAPSVVSARAATASRADARSQVRSIPDAETRPVPRSQLAPERVYGNARPAAGRSTPPPSRATARPAERAPARPATRKAAQDVERIDDRPRVPDISVVRTAWHPRADRRSARVRLESTREVMTLAEGDAIGGLIVQEITPSAVLFRAGEVEIRRRVGASGR